MELNLTLESRETNVIKIGGRSVCGGHSKQSVISIICTSAAMDGFSAAEKEGEGKLKQQQAHHLEI